MTTLCSSLSLRRHTALLAAFTLILTACLFVPSAGAQEAAKSETSNGLEPATVTPYAEFQNSTQTGTTNTINVIDLPVVTSTGTIIYDNITVLFNVAADGALTVASGYPKIVASSIGNVSLFMAGTYLGSDDSDELLTVSGPAITQGGGVEWSFGPATGASGCLFPNSGNWFVGPLKSNILYQRILTAGISTVGNTLSFGMGGSNCGTSSFWQTGTLMGFAQTGNQITIYSFTENGADKSSPVDQKTYTRQGP